MNLAASIAESRFERLRAQDCGVIAAGASASRGIEERWTVARTAQAVHVSDTVVFSLRRGRQVHVFETVWPCHGSAP